MAHYAYASIQEILTLLSAQLLMGRRLQSTLPMLPSLLEQNANKEVKEKLHKRQKQQKYYYDKTAKQLPPLKPNDVVRFKHKSYWKPAVVMGIHSSPRSYTIRTTDGTFIRRNRRHLKKTDEQRPPSESYWYEEDQDSSGGTLSQQQVVWMACLILQQLCQSHLLLREDPGMVG